MKYPKILLAIIITAGLLSSCDKTNSDKQSIDFVNPFIGTGGHGHTYSGATSPFGMVQLGPDTRLSGWDGCSGYHYSDSVIYGFSHTHLSGTGVSDYGDILLMPINGKAVFENTEYASEFSHNDEFATAGYYSVLLRKNNIKVELITSARTGMHKYSFAKAEDNKVVIDLKHRDIVKDSYIKQIGDSAIEGYRISKAWAQEQHIYFYMQFSEPIVNIAIKNDDKIKDLSDCNSKSIVSVVSFGNIDSKELMIKIGISAVDLKGAKKNLLAENTDWNFEKFKKQNQKAWAEELDKIEIDDADESRKTIFYTSLYHNLIVPNIFSDVDGRYRGMDLKIHKSKTDQYTIFSLWDTYRATHPLYTIIETQRTADFIGTFQNQYHDGGILPIWELAGNYTGCMIGYHSIPVIVDAYFKGLTDIPAEDLLQMMLISANANKHGLEAYRKNLFISVADDAESVSKTLEYAYDDWCIAQLAKEIKNDSIYKIFIKRAQAYKNILDPELGYMRPKRNQIWKTPFDPSEVDFNYTEANSWQYSFYVPHDMFTFRDMLGGNARFEKQLDDLFNASTQTTGREQSDISGLIGQYAHGNEPSHHIAYLYNYVNKSEKTQNYVQRIMDELYTDKADGLCGNEDCGQMSAWYVFSSMGFYPVNPANGEFVFGKPAFGKMTLNLENGNKFIIKKQGKGKYVHQIELNGKTYPKAYINYSDIMAGGELVFIMSNDSAIEFDENNLPNSVISDNVILTSPSIRGAKRVFQDSTVIIMEAQKGTTIYYSIDNNMPIEYSKPFVIYKNTNMKLWAEKDGKQSNKVEAKFFKIPNDRSISITNKWHSQYGAGGNNALIDGIQGSNNFRTGGWQGYYFVDFEAIIDFGKAKEFSSISTNFMQDARSWIFMPEYVEYWVSNNNKDFKKIARIENNISKKDEEVQIKAFVTKEKKMKYRYIKVFAKNHNICPEGHLGAGGKGYVFLDEIVVE